MKKRIALAGVILAALVAVGGLLSHVQAQSSNRGPAIDCILTTTATTSTLITGCHAPEPGQAIYITDISVFGGITTAATAAATIQSGTGGACGTGTKIHHYCQHVATDGCEAHFVTAIRAVPEGEVCLLDATVGTKFVAVKGYVGSR